MHSFKILLQRKPEKYCYGECIWKPLSELIWILKQVQKLSIFKNNVYIQHFFAEKTKKNLLLRVYFKAIYRKNLKTKTSAIVNIFDNNA